MCSGKGISGKLVVKFLLIKTDDLEIHSMMVAVALGAGFAAHLHGRVVSFMLRNS